MSKEYREFLSNKPPVGQKLKPFKCYFCDHDVSRDEEKHCHQSGAPYRTEDGKRVMVCQGCWVKAIEDQVNKQYKGREARRHNKARKQTGRF